MIFLHKKWVGVLRCQPIFYGEFNYPFILPALKSDVLNKEVFPIFKIVGIFT